MLTTGLVKLEVRNTPASHAEDTDDFFQVNNIQI